ncbi:type I-U CRISPR-associated protein Cas7 [Streptomonospora sp. PA3]|uniref:type I-G CRISPR-associated RAMP protein Csb1/Cas7g n=1 Tax=Streptomonospora sp. PA3 TaxID=2607326 RepID=UPI0012DD7031|nr:type I-U CRISPR-associated RAMP protein Csb1/Cas7u [Streptomonospora sp. PA3]MUL41635.1 type I-U CRISPR-associated protein Cas7 [Streptomonospora sp. PA3]
MSEELVQTLLGAVDEKRTLAGIATHARYRPPEGEKVFPPTFPLDGTNAPTPALVGQRLTDEHGQRYMVVREQQPHEIGRSPDDKVQYLIEPRRIAGETREIVVLDQVPSQANRMEAALLAARDAGRIRLPLFELTMTASDGIPMRLTSLEFPHRFADAYLRDSLLDGVAFDRTPVGQRLRSATAHDVRPLFAYSPESLIFGAWDSHRKGRSLKVARSYSSSVIGMDPQVGQRRSGRMDPNNLSGAVKPGHNGTDWAFVASGEKKKGERLSEVGHGNIAPGVDHGGVVISQAQRSGWLSLAGLAQLRFGDAGAEAAHLARAALAALALAADRLAFDTVSLRLRSGCDLVRTEDEVALDAGTRREPLQVDAESAIAAFHELAERAGQAGIPMATDTVALAPNPALAQAIDYALSRADTGEAE